MSVHISHRLFSTRRIASKGRAIIVGGGPCGATTALALDRKGVECHVFERVAKHVENAGGAFTIHGGGVCLKYLGLEKEYKEISDTLDKIIYTTMKGQHLYTLTKDKLEKAIETTNDENVKRADINLVRGLMRADFYNMLQNECSKPDNNIHLNNNKEFDKYEKLPNGNIKVWFKDGTNITGDILLGCDGINSKVRRQFLNDNSNIFNIKENPCQYTGFSGWYSVGNLIDIKDDLLTSQDITPDMKQSILNDKGYTMNFELNESSMAMFSICPKADKYNFFLGFNNNNLNYGMLNDDDDDDINDWDVNILYGKKLREQQNFIRKYKFNPFFHECTKLHERMIGYDIYNVRMTGNGNHDEMGDGSHKIPWFDDKVLLLGDAAHGIPPFGGQGCNQAIYDSVCLAHLFGSDHGSYYDSHNSYIDDGIIRKNNINCNNVNLNDSEQTRDWFKRFYQTRSVITDPTIEMALKLGETFHSPVETHTERNKMIKSGMIANLIVQQWVPQLGDGCADLALGLESKPN